MFEDGLSIYGKNKNALPWQEYLAEVAKHARKKRAYRVPKFIPCNDDPSRNLLNGKDRPDARRCKHFGKKSGRRCKNWAMKGATRCHFHGGYRQVPKHPATIRKFIRGDMHKRDEHNKARQAVYDMPKEAVRAATEAAGRKAPFSVIKAGALAYIEGGVAWRHWIRSIAP